MKKRILAVLLCLSLAAGLLAGCGGEAPSSQADPTPAPEVTAEPTPEPTPEPEPEPEEARTFDSDHDAMTGRPAEGEQPRPIAVMLNDRLEAGDLWGIAEADVVVEVLTEGRVPGLMAVYSGYEDLPDRVGPVADGRDPFWQMILPYNGVPVQIDSNIYASNLLNYYSYQPIEARSAGKDAFAFSSRGDRNHEYGWYITQDLYRNALGWYGMEDESERPVPDLFRFAGEGEALPLPAENAGSASRLKMTFADGWSIRLPYDGDSGLYEKYTAANEPQRDGNNDETVAFKNLFVLSCRAGVKDDGYTREYDLTGGEGLYLTGGTWQLIRWEKGDPMDPLKLYDQDGGELLVAPGSSYIALYGGFAGQEVELTVEGGEKLEPLSAMEPLPAPEPEPEEAPEEEPEDE